MSMKIFALLSLIVFNIFSSHFANAQISKSTVTVQGVLKMYNGRTSTMTIEMTGPYMAECWANPANQNCSAIIYWDGYINGRKVTNWSNGGSTFTEHLFRTGQKPSLMIKDCGPYVGACEYYWSGYFNPSTQAYEGDISYYPATYGHLTIYKNNARFVRR